MNSCYPECAKLEYESCGGVMQLSGICGVGLKCQVPPVTPLGPLAEGRCVRANDDVMLLEKDDDIIKMFRSKYRVIR